MNRFALFSMAVCLSVPAIAQPVPNGPALPSPEEIRNANGFTLGVGGAFVPDYEGSNDYRLIPAAAARGKVDGISFTTRGLYLYVDVVPAASGTVDFDAGPIAGVRLNRTRHVKDDIVALLPERKTAIEVGGFAGISLHGLTNPYDTLSFRLDAFHDVANAHKSTVFSPAAEFSTPLSHTLFVGASASADFVSNRYADYYFSISPAETALSGLPTFNASGGMKDWKLSLLADQSLSGDLRHGLSLFATGSYSRLVGDFKRSPIVSQRGSANQWLAAAGLAYSF